MSDEILIQMSQQIGELNGKLDAHLGNQDRINTALFELAGKHDTRIRATESTGTRALTVAGVVSTMTAAAIEFVARFWPHGGGNG
jgi:hypothetical protein